MSADRCPTCDREGCAADMASCLAEMRRAYGNPPYESTSDPVAYRQAAARMGEIARDCNAARVDWRARALAAEDRIAQVAEELADDLATAQAEIDHAIASPRGMGGALPSMSRLRHGATPTVRAWLGRLVAKLRGGAVDSDAAKDRDAAKWRKVEPMIERLRVAADEDTSDTIHVVDAAIELLAAAKEPS